MTTINDVAKRAGVSIATVSCCLSGARNVKPETKAKILEVIDELNYIPNSAARNLKTKESREIGVIVPNINDSYYIDILKGIIKFFQHHKYNVTISFSDEIVDKEISSLNNFLSKNINGVIIISCQPNNNIFFYDNFIKRNIPIVFLDRKISNLDATFLKFDNKETMHFITSELINSGYIKIALITGPQEYTCESDCVDGFINAFYDKDKNPDSYMISRTNLSKEDSFSSTLSILQEITPDIIIASSESIVKGVLEAAYIKDIQIPEELMVLALGQEYWNRSNVLKGTVSTLRNAFNFGEQAAEILFKNIASPIFFEKREIAFKDRIIIEGLDVEHKKKANINLPHPRSSNNHINVLMLECKTANAIRSMLPNFTKNTSINVKITTCQRQYLLKRIIEDCERGIEDIDIYMYDIPWLPNIASNNCLADITDYIGSEYFNKDSFIPENLKHCEFQGKFYGVPIMVGVQLLFYRKDLFNDKKLAKEFQNKYKTNLRPPRTWFEFNGIAEFFTKASNPDSPTDYGTSIPALYSEYLAPEILIRLWAYGGEIFDNKNNIIINSAESIKAISNFCKSFKYTSPDALNYGLDTAISEFIEGRIAMLPSFTNLITEINNRAKSKVIGKVGYELIPGRTPIMAGWNLGLSRFSRKKDLVFKFFDWTYRRDINYYSTILEGQSPILDVYKSDELQKLYPWLPIVLDTFKYCKVRKSPYKPGYKVIPHDRIEFFLVKAVYSILKGESNVETALYKAQKELEEFFESYGFKQNRI